MTDRDPDPAAVIGRFLEAMNALDYDGIEAILAEDHVSEYPQSGEIIRGARTFARSSRTTRVGSRRAGSIASSLGSSAATTGR